MKLNKSLMYVNEHQRCVMEQQTSDVDKLQQRLVQMSTQLEGQPINCADTEEFRGKLASAQHQIKLLLASKTTIEQELTELKTRYKETLEELDEAHTLVGKHLDNASQHKMRTADLNVLSDTLRSKLRMVEDQLSDRQKELDVERSLQMEAIAQWRDQEKEMKADLEETQRSLLDVQQAMSQLEDSNTYLSECKKKVEKQYEELKVILDIEKVCANQQTSLSFFATDTGVTQTERDTGDTSTQTLHNTLNESVQASSDTISASVQTRIPVLINCMSQTHGRPVLVSRASQSDGVETLEHAAQVEDQYLDVGSLEEEEEDLQERQLSKIDGVAVKYGSVMLEGAEKMSDTSEECAMSDRYSVGHGSGRDNGQSVELILRKEVLPMGEVSVRHSVLNCDGDDFIIDKNRKVEELAVAQIESICKGNQSNVLKSSKELNCEGDAHTGGSKERTEHVDGNCFEKHHGQSPQSLEPHSTGTSDHLAHYCLETDQTFNENGQATLKPLFRRNILQPPLQECSQSTSCTSLRGSLPIAKHDSHTVSSSTTQVTWTMDQHKKDQIFLVPKVCITKPRKIRNLYSEKTVLWGTPTSIEDPKDCCKKSKRSHDSPSSLLPMSEVMSEVITSMVAEKGKTTAEACTRPRLKMGLRMLAEPRATNSEGTSVGHPTVGNGCHVSPCRTSRSSGIAFGEGRHFSERSPRLSKPVLEGLSREAHPSTGRTSVLQKKEKSPRSGKGILRSTLSVLASEKKKTVRFKNIISTETTTCAPQPGSVARMPQSPRMPTERGSPSLSLAGEELLFSDEEGCPLRTLQSSNISLQQVASDSSCPPTPPSRSGLKTYFTTNVQSPLLNVDLAAPVRRPSKFHLTQTSQQHVSGHTMYHSEINSPQSPISSYLPLSVVSPHSFEGVLSTSNSTDVLSTGNSTGVLSTGNSTGVLSTGNSTSILSTGNNPGILSTCNTTGVLSTGNTTGVLSTGNNPGILSTGNTTGVMSTSNTTGVLSTGNITGVLSTGNNPGILSTRNTKGVLSTCNTTGVLSTGVLCTGNTPDILSTGNTTGGLSTGNTPGILSSDTSPCAQFSCVQSPVDGSTACSANLSHMLNSQPNRPKKRKLDQYVLL